MKETAAAKRPATREQRLLADQVRLLYSNLPGGLFAGLFNAVVLSLVQMEAIASPIVAAWLGTITALTVVRYLITRSYLRRQVDAQDAKRWLWSFGVGTALSGLVWGSGAVLLFPADLPHQIFLVFVLAGMTAGAVVSFSAVVGIALAFLVPVLVPITVRLFAEGGDIHLAMAMMSTLFMAMMVVTTQRMYQTTLASLRLRFANEDLVATLAGEKEATERLNAELTREIQERVRVEEGLRQGEHRIRAVVDNVLDGIITINDLGIVESMNRAAERIFGYGAREIVGQHFKMLMPEAERDEYDDYLKRHIGIANKGRMIGFGLEIAGQRKDGTVFPMELGMSEMWHERGRLFIGIVRDITERKRAERMKSDFLSVVSHELRTPLTSVLGSLELLGEGVAGDLSERGRSLLGMARSNIERLVRLIGDILDMDDIHSGKMRLECRRVELATLAERAVESSHAYAAGLGVRLRIERRHPNLYVYADEQRMLQVLHHLLSNAVKFSPPLGLVQVTVERVRGGVHVSVVDQGPGIPVEVRPRLFQAFAPTDSRRPHPRSGVGLGLSIAKAIIDKHGGRIGFEPGEAGARFYFELPEWQDEQSITARQGR